MQDAIDTLGAFFAPIIEFLQNAFAGVNGAQGLIIAIIAVVFMARWAQLWFYTLLATVVYALIEHFWPIVQSGAELRLPNVTEPDYWWHILALYVGLFIIIAIFFFVKSLLFRRAPAANH
ncbi:MAG: hypothetical protein AB7J28_17010 [Hyphomonadaceae bacterium]